MKKTLAIFAILLMAFSSLAFAEGEDPAPEAASEPAPSETPSEPEAPAEAPSEPTEAPPSEPNLPPALPPGEQQPPQGEQMPPQEGGEGGDMPTGDENRQPQQGPGTGGCWVGEQQVPCPGEGQQYEGRQPIVRAPSMGEGCTEVRDANGMFTVNCAGQQRAPEQFDCTPGPQREQIEKECAAKGGRTIVKNMVQSKGCGIVDCVFGGSSEGNFMPGQQQACPGPDDLAKQEENCKSMGLNPKRMRSNCEFVQCEDPNKQQTMCPDVSLERVQAKEQCNANGGTMVDEFDAYGCSVPKCISSGQQCQNNVPQEAYFKCEDLGGKLVVNSDANGCITFSKCVMRGEEGVQAEDELDAVPPAAKLLSVALKLESIKISFDQMANQITAIADYYDNEGDSANAERFRTAAGMFESAKKQIDGVKEELKMGVKGMSVEQIIDIKHKIRQISDVVMEDALYVILGGEATGIGAEETTAGYEPEEAKKDCGSDGNCFGKALRICQPEAQFNPQAGAEIKIVGLEGGICILKGMASSADGEKDLSCKFADYATDQLTIDNVIQYCEGSLVEYMKQNMEQFAAQNAKPALNSQQAFEGQMMGCEKVDKGINKRGVCGNECCEERFGESYYSCPSDCMGPQQQQIQQAPMIQRQPLAERQQVYDSSGRVSPFPPAPTFQNGRQQDSGNMGCQDEISGESPKDVCGNECCEPGESSDNCPADCRQGNRPEYQETPVQGIERMPFIEPPRRPIESTPTEGEVTDVTPVGCTTNPDGTTSCAASGSSSGGGGSSAPAESTSSGGMAAATGEGILNAGEELLGRKEK